MKKKLIFIIFCLSCFFLVAIGSTVAQTPIANSTPKPVTNQDWLLLMLKNLPRYVCLDNGVWLACYGIATSQCQEVAWQPSKDCLNEIAPILPETLTPDDGAKWGKELAVCFMKRFDAAHPKTNKESPECKLPPKHLRAS